MTTPVSSDWRARASLYCAVIVVIWLVLVTGTAAGWLVPWVRVINVAMMAVLVALWVRGLTREMDAVDGASVVVVIAVGASAVGSILPRLSGEAFYAALAFAALFGLVRRLGPADREVVIQALALVGTVLAAVFFGLWSATWVQWTQATGLAPSLEIDLPSAPFGQRHNVALLLGLMLPACLVAASGSLGRRITIAGAIALVVAVMFMSGGRAVWLGAAAATLAWVVAAGFAHDVRSWLARYKLLTAGAALALVVLALGSGLGESILSRILTTSSLDMRGAMWGASLAGWAEQPGSGTGPGSFTFGLFATDYFDRSVFLPKHADNVYLQALTELGILGALSLGLLAITIARHWMSKPPTAPTVWALMYVAVAGIGANPAALGYCAILMVFWAGAATPWVRGDGTEMPQWVSIAAPAFLVLVAALPLWTTSGAALAFERARVLSNAGQVDSAIASLDEAVRLDPTHPLYVRERGVQRLRDGRTPEALDDLRAASLLNPFDDTTLRALGLAELHAGNVAPGLAAARSATDLQATDPMNQATLALAAHESRLFEERDAALARLLVLAPWAAADESWSDRFPGVEPSLNLRDAAELVPQRPVADSIDLRWTLALGGVPGLNADAGFSAGQVAVAHLVECRFGDALRVVDTASPAERSEPHYWLVRYIVNQLNGVAVDVVVVPADPLASAPFGDRVGDEARYARLQPGTWDGLRLPSDVGGRSAWLDDPGRALAVTRGEPCP